MRNLLYFKSPRAQPSRGFSLIELMVVTAIISVLATIAMKISGDLNARAKESEGLANSKVLYALTKSYREENQGHMETTWRVSNNYYVTETGCNNSGSGATIGFKLTDCRKINFMYMVYFTSNFNVTAMAIEGSTITSKRIYPNCCGASLAVTNEHGSFQTISPRNTASCGEPMMDRVGAVDPTNMSFDLNGDNVADSNDNWPLVYTMMGNPNPMNYILSCP